MRLPEISIEDCAYLEVSIADFHNACLLQLKKEVRKSRRQLAFIPWFMRKKRSEICLKILAKIELYENVARIATGLLAKLDIAEAPDTQEDGNGYYTPMTFKQIKEMSRTLKK
jgi:hypothetical protein